MPLSPDDPKTQLESLIAFAHLPEIFGAPVEPLPSGVISVAQLPEAEDAQVPILCRGEVVGVLLVSAFDEGPSNSGLTLGLRGWWLNEDTSSLTR